MIHYTKHVYESTATPLFSIVIPTWNNLEMLQLCIKSILKNSTHQHQIILHLNEGSDGTKAWAEQQQFSHTHSEANIGVCYALNAAVALAKTDYIVYMNDDMYVVQNGIYFFGKKFRKCLTISISYPQRQ